jgi:hypothetical protein
VESSKLPDQIHGEKMDRDDGWAACRKLNTMAMAAVTITAREMGENRVKPFII